MLFRVIDAQGRPQMPVTHDGPAAKRLVDSLNGPKGPARFFVEQLNIVHPAPPAPAAPAAPTEGDGPA